MNVTSINQASGNLSVTQSKQDSHEKNIRQQIMSLQDKMRNITYDNEMPDEEKSNEKKSLQEKIQSLNSELKQYQIQKRQEDAEKRQQETKKREETQRQQETSAKQEQAEAGKAAVSSNVNTTSSAGETVSSEYTSENTASVQDSEVSADTQAAAGFSDDESDAMIAFANTKEHLAEMQKLYTNLQGLMRTASTDTERADIQKKINSVSKSMGKKMQKVADTITDTHNENEKRKEKIRKKKRELEERKQNMNAVVSGSEQKENIDYGYWQKNSTLGKVFLTRKKS